MKKALTFIFLLSLFSANAYSQIEKVNSGFRECVSYSYTCINGKPDADTKAKSAEFEYDKKGNYIEYTSYLDNEVDEKQSADYDDNFNMIEEIIKHADGTEDKTIYKYNYDANNRILSKTQMNGAEQVVSVFEYKYDDSGNKIEEMEKKSGNAIQSRKTFKYDNSILSEAISYKSNGEVSSTTTYLYDAKRNPLEEISVSAAGDTLTQTQIKYDESGKKTEQLLYVSSKFPSEKIKFGANGNRSELTLFTPEGNIMYLTKYDEYGNQIEYTIYDDTNKPATRFEFVYSK